ncbi:MAG: GtrA family protein [Acidimicrobiales bacterium]
MSTLRGTTRAPAPEMQAASSDALAHGAGWRASIVARVKRAGPKGVARWLLDAHWLGHRRTPFILRLWRYGAGSVVAFVTSEVVLAICFSGFQLGGTKSPVIAFFAGAIPNWILNRRWAWQKRGRDGVGRETTLYVIVSVINLVLSTAATKLTAELSSNAGQLARDLLVSASYTFSIVVLTILKYFVYDRFVFVDRGRRRSRSQVATTTLENRQP